MSKKFEIIVSRKTNHEEISRRSVLRGVTGVTALCATGGLSMLTPAWAAEQPIRGGALNLAMIGEPQSLDPMASVADLVGTITQHIYETLYTFDKSSAVMPSLAEKMPEVSADALTYTIPLRKGVFFHDGQEMKAEDVVASVTRWTEMAPRGKAVGAVIETLTAKDPHTIEFKLKTRYAPLLAQLAMPAGGAVIMPKAKLEQTLKEFIGTGPYKLKERKPDQYVQLVRHDKYAPLDTPATGYAGKREALADELRFIPVPNANTRVEGSLGGQYHYADLLPVETYSRLEGKSNIAPLLIKNFGFAYIVLNTKLGVLSDIRLRQAVQMALNHTEMLSVGFGDPKFFSVEAPHYPSTSIFHAKDGTEAFNVADAKKAAALVKEAGYDGKPIRILASQQYEFHYRMALVMAENLKAAGFKVDLQVSDWATLIQRRGDPSLWDIYVTHSVHLPDPSLTPPQLGDNAPGGWDTSAKREVLGAFNSEPDPQKRAKLWGKVQAVVFEEVPYIRIGDFNGLAAVSPKLQNYHPMPWPFFWNVWLSK